jgi:hypothetical protein
MADAIVKDLRAKGDAVWTNLVYQLQGMEPYLDRSDAPGEWTTRQVLSHLLSEPGWNPVDTLKTFADRDLPVIEIHPGRVTVNDDRRAMTLKQFVEGLDGRRRQVFAYLDGLTDAQLRRKARVPLLKQFLGTEEIDLPTFVGLIFERHWSDHVGQLAKIRKAVGLPDAK